MKGLHILPLVALFLLTSFIGCKREEESTGNLMITFEMKKDGQVIALNDVFENDSVPAVRIEKLKFYFSHLNLLGRGEIEDVDIVDFEEGRTSFIYKNIKTRNYKGITYDVGLDLEQNASYPPDFAAGTPLSASWAMYWSWASKYRFVIIEGRGATDGVIDASPDDILLVIHPGMDGWEQPVTLNTSIDIEKDLTTEVVVHIDMDRMFNGPAGFMDLRVENMSHTTVEDSHIALKFIENFAAAMYVE